MDTGERDNFYLFSSLCLSSSSPCFLGLNRTRNMVTTELLTNENDIKSLGCGSITKAVCIRDCQWAKVFSSLWRSCLKGVCSLLVADPEHSSLSAVVFMVTAIDFVTAYLISTIMVVTGMFSWFDLHVGHGKVYSLKPSSGYLLQQEVELLVAC